MVCYCAPRSSCVYSKPQRDRQKEQGLDNAMNALGPQGREIQWAKRESAKQDLTSTGVLPRPLVIATKGAKGSKNKGLSVRP